MSAFLTSSRSHWKRLLEIRNMVSNSLPSNSGVVGPAKVVSVETNDDEVTIIFLFFILWKPSMIKSDVFLLVGRRIIHAIDCRLCHIGNQLGEHTHLLDHILVILSSDLHVVDHGCVGQLL